MGGKEAYKTGLATALSFFQVPWAVVSVLEAVGPRAAAAPVALSLGMDLASEAVDDKAHVFVVCFGFVENATPSRTHSPN